MLLNEPALLAMDQSYTICIFTVSEGFFCIREGGSIRCNNIKIKEKKHRLSLCCLGVKVLNDYLYKTSTEMP